MTTSAPRRSRRRPTRRGFFRELYREFHPNETRLNSRVTETNRRPAPARVVRPGQPAGLDSTLEWRSSRPRRSARTSAITLHREEHDPERQRHREGRGRQAVAGCPGRHVAFPEPSERDDADPPLPTADGKVTGWGGVGTSPYGKRRDVKVTVQTGAVTMTPTPWFMATRRLATGRAGLQDLGRRRDGPSRRDAPGSHRGRAIRPAGASPISR